MTSLCDVTARTFDRTEGWKHMKFDNPSWMSLGWQKTFHWLIANVWLLLGIFPQFLKTGRQICYALMSSSRYNHDVFLRALLHFSGRNSSQLIIETNETFLLWTSFILFSASVLCRKDVFFSHQLSRQSEPSVLTAVKSVMKTRSQHLSLEMWAFHL